MNRFFAAIVCAALGCLAGHSASAQTFQGKLWVVSPAQAANLAFPAPSAVPDATWGTNGIAYIGQGTQPLCYKIGTFLGKCVTAAQNLNFSGLGNRWVGGFPVTPLTSVGGTHYGVIMEFTGSVLLVSGQPIPILHDDGVSLLIDGAPVPGFDSGITAPVLETAIFTGATGYHTIDLLYANAAGVPAQTGAWLLFTPKLF